MTTGGLVSLSKIARKAIGKRDWQTLEKAASMLLSDYPNDPETHFIAGISAKVLGRSDNARKFFEQGFKLAPDRFDLRLELANQMLADMQHGEAYRLVHAVKHSLSNSPYYSDLAATILVELGLPQEAVAHAENAHRLQPEVDIFAANLANCYSYVGQTKTAVGLYEALLSDRPQNRRNHYFLSRLRKARNQQHIDVMKAVLTEDEQPDSRNIFLFFALGKAHEDLELWEDSFYWYKRGCDAVSGVAPGGLNMELQKMRFAAGRAINPANSNFRQRPDPLPYRPVFIVGLPRSGSTLIERVLTNHSSVQSVGETRYFEYALQRVFDDIPTGLSLFSTCDPKLNEQVADLYIKTLSFRLGPEPVVIEKLPLNFNLVPAIASAFPDALFIYTYREPEAACFAMYKQLFTGEYLFSYDLEDVATYYVAHNTFRSRFSQILAERWLELSYEELVADPTQIITVLLGRLSLPIEADCFTPEMNKAASMTASSIQVREPINQNTKNVWRQYERNLGPMLSVLTQPPPLRDGRA